VNSGLLFLYQTIGREYLYAVKNYKVIIKGKVVGVGFRFFIKQSAILNDVYGYVIYLNNDSLLLQACGNESNLDKFLELCQLGCQGVYVSEMIIEKDDNPGDYKDFEIRENV
jgi:acylphosphatase